MKRISLMLVFFVWEAYASGISLLQNIAWVEQKDSLELKLAFGGDLPEKYRVTLVKDSTAQIVLMLAFLGADTAKITYSGGAAPNWLRIHAETEKGRQVLRLFVAVEREVAFRGEWKGSQFSLVLPNTLPTKRPIWKNPWVYVGVGAATVGGAVFWLTTGKSTSSKSEEIAPPDIELPE